MKVSMVEHKSMSPGAWSDGIDTQLPGLGGNLMPLSQAPSVENMFLRSSGPSVRTSVLAEFNWRTRLLIQLLMSRRQPRVDRVRSWQMFSLMFTVL